MSRPAPEALAGAKVLVTGATGFIGSRLALRLDAIGAEVTGSGRRVDEVPLLAASGVRLEKADLRDAAAMGALCVGQDVVFHVAAWLGADRPIPEPAWAINVEATEALVRSAAEAGVRRFVLVSTIAVYGAPPDGPLGVDTPMDVSPRNDEYGRTKAEGEKRAVALGAQLGVEVAVVRPGMVYGPGSWTWTAGMLKLVRKGTPVLVGAGDGHASPVFVEDLVDLLVLAAARPEAAGRVFHGVDRPAPWTEFFGFYGAMCGRKPRRMPMWLARILAVASEKLPLGLPLTRSRLEHMKAKPVYLIDEGRDLLGWTPATTLEQGMALSADWLRSIGKL
jgi:nucleoside-diphosphate-sugar epimerase